MIETTLLPIDRIGALDPYDAIVCGSATYFGHWMKGATNFVRNNAQVLAERPVWLFSCGPLGSNAQGKENPEKAEPREIAEFRAAIHPRDHRVFFGAMDPQKLGLLHRFITFLPVNWNNALFPVGDFRDRNQIGRWAVNMAALCKAAKRDHFSAKAMRTCCDFWNVVSGKGTLVIRSTAFPDNWSTPGSDSAIRALAFSNSLANSSSLMGPPLIAVTAPLRALL